MMVIQNGGPAWYRNCPFGVSSVNANKEDEQMIKDLQRNAVMRDPTMAAATLAGAQAEAMKAAAANEAAGPAMAFMGMNMAANAGGMNAQNLFAMGQQQQQQQQQQKAQSQPAPDASGWTCSCGYKGNTGRFCEECGKPKASADGWNCSCGAVNKGKFCTQCGKPKPAGVPQYKCDKCGWEPADKTKPPKFCPDCGDPFDDGDIQ